MEIIIHKRNSLFKIGCMDILPHILTLASGLIILILGANLLINGATTLAFRYGIPPVVVGLTVVALGTSLPEMGINLIASLEKASGITMGNIVGSNITNILLIIGLASIVKPIRVSRMVVKKEIPLSFLGTLLLIAMTMDPILDGTITPFLSRTEGLILLITFIGYIYFLAAFLERGKVDIPQYTGKFPSIQIATGIIGLMVGARMVVHGGVRIAEMSGMSQAFVGMFIIAIGTSLPELVTSVVAAYRGKHDIAIGNIAGSNIFNITLVLGISALIYPIEVHPLINRDLSFLLLATALFVIFYMTGRGYTISRREGIIFVTLYLFYLIYSLKMELSG